MDLEEAVALRKVEREMTSTEKLEKQRRRRLVDNAKSLCEWAFFRACEMRSNKE